MLNLLNIDLNPGKATFAHPYSSITGVTANQVLVFTLLALLIVLYVIVRVWWSLKKDKITNQAINPQRKIIKKKNKISN